MLIKLLNCFIYVSFSTDIFTFDLYDKDASGELSPGEISQMLKDIYGKNHINDAKVKL